MGFIEEWQEAIASDPQWQFEDAYEELDEIDHELAEGFAKLVATQNAVAMLAYKRLQMNGVVVPYEDVFQFAQEI